MSDTFRVILVGAGRIVSQSHLPAVLACPAVQITAIVDSVEQRARELADAFGLTARATTSLDDALSLADGAIIAAPNAAHFELAAKCINAKVHALVEKPLTTSVADGERLVRMAEAANVTVAVGYCTRFVPSVRFMGELLKSGYFGRVSRFAYQAGGGRGGWEPLSAYTLDRRSSGGGVMTVNGSHFLDRMLDWFGYPAACGMADDSLGGPEANGVATFRYDKPSPMTGLVRISKTVPLPRGLVLETEAGTVVMPDADDGQIVLRPKDRPAVECVIRPRQRVAPLDMYVAQFADFVDACRLRRSPLVTGRQGLDSVRLLAELYANHAAMEQDYYRAAAGVVG